MKWGFMTPAHIISIIAAVAMNVGLYYLLKDRSRRTRKLGLLPFSLLGVAAIIFNLLTWDSPLEYLPLHLCSINAILLPIVVLTGSKVLGNLLLVWCLGALAAILLNFEMVNVELASWTFFFYYVPHVFEFGVPILLFKLKLVEKDHKCIASTLSITMLIYTAVHLCNKLINAYCAAVGSGIRVNYMFSINPTNPLVALFHRIVPFEYWYMYMVLPIAAVYLLIVYAPQIREARRTRRPVPPLRRKIAH